MSHLRPDPRPRRRHRVVGAALGATLLVLTGPAAVAAATEAPPADAASAISATSPAADPSAPAAPEPAADPEAPTDLAPEPAADAAPAPAPLAATAEVRAAAVAGPPRVTATPTTGLNPAGGSTITVNGNGFDPVANNKFGVYVVFGPVDPGTYFKEANRFLAAMWMHPGGGASGSPGQGELTAGGTFSARLPATGGAPITARYTDGNGAPVDCLTTQCYVVTMAAHGVADRSQDTCTPVSFAGGTATPGVDGSCKPVTTPAGQPTGPSASPAGSDGTNGTGASGANGSNGGSSGGSGSSTLPRTGTATTALVTIGLGSLAAGLLLVRRSRRDPSHTGRGAPALEPRG